MKQKNDNEVEFMKFKILNANEKLTQLSEIPTLAESLIKKLEAIVLNEITIESNDEGRVIAYLEHGDKQLGKLYEAHRHIESAIALLKDVSWYNKIKIKELSAQ